MMWHFSILRIVFSVLLDVLKDSMKEARILSVLQKGKLSPEGKGLKGCPAGKAAWLELKHKAPGSKPMASPQQGCSEKEECGPGVQRC